NMRFFFSPGVTTPGECRYTPYQDMVRTNTQDSGGVDPTFTPGRSLGLAKKQKKPNRNEAIWLFS
ncbi:MAG: hypothetical protein ACI8YQ_003562, partial [Polaribacter sp.]